MRSVHWHRQTNMVEGVSSRTVEKIRIDWSVGANRRFDKLESTPFNARGSFLVEFTTNSRCNSCRRSQFERVKRAGSIEGTRGGRWLMRFDTVINVPRQRRSFFPFLVSRDSTLSYWYFLGGLRNGRKFHTVCTNEVEITRTLYAEFKLVVQTF